MLFIGIWASMLDGVTIVVDNFVMSPLVGVEKCSCSLVKTCEDSRRLFACMFCEWRDSTLAIGKERREDVALLSSDAVYPHGHSVMISQRLWWGNRVGVCEDERLDHPFSGGASSVSRRHNASHNGPS